MLTKQWLADSQDFLDTGVEAPTHAPPRRPDGQGSDPSPTSYWYSQGSPASCRPPSSGSSSGPHSLPDTAQQTARDHARHWLQGVVHDSEAEEAATQEIEARSVVAFLRNEQGHHV